MTHTLGLERQKTPQKNQPKTFQEKPTTENTLPGYKRGIEIYDHQGAVSTLWLHFLGRSHYNVLYKINGLSWDL